MVIWDLLILCKIPKHNNYMSSISTSTAAAAAVLPLPSATDCKITFYFNVENTDLQPSQFVIKK